MGPLSGQLAIISGGLGDIGRAIAIELACRGADIGICDILDESLAIDLLAVIRDHNVRAHYAKVDVSDSIALQSWIDTIAEVMGVLPSLIIPNAAIVAISDVRSVTPEEWARHMRINLDGSFFMAQFAALKLSAAGKAGRVVFIGSWAAHASHLKIPAYCASKAALRMGMKCLALEFAKDGILVNEVAPGFVDAGLSAKIFEQNPGSRESSAAKVPNQTLITPAEVALQVAWLCDPSNLHVTGSVLLMDGGLSLVSAANG